MEITNTGKLPILPDDFISPLSVIASKHLKILNVFEHETKMQAKWNSFDNMLVLEPLLLNPGDTIICVMILGDNTLSREQFIDKYVTENPTTPMLYWDARITGVKKLDIRNRRFDKVQYFQTKILIPFGIFLVNIRGYSVYVFLIISFLLICAWQLIYILSYPFSKALSVNVVVNVAGILFSVMTSEIIISIISIKQYGMQYFHWINFLIITLHTLFIYFVIRYRRMPKKTLQPTKEVGD